MNMEMLGCKTPEIVQKEIAVHLLAYKIIRKIWLWPLFFMIKFRVSLVSGRRHNWSVKRVYK